MSALPQPLAMALRGFAPPPEPEADALRRQLRQIATERDSLLRLPWAIEVETAPARLTGLPENCAAAEHASVDADEDIVRDVIDRLIDRHIDELDAEIARRQHARWKAGRSE